jgi:hypothetical protein
MIVTVAEALLVESALLVAVTVAVALVVTAAAVKFPEESMVPTVELPPAVPATDQVTPFELPVTEAMNCVTWLAPMVAAAGVTATVTAGVTLTEAEALLVASATLVAVTVAVAAVVTLGAVKLPEESMVPVAVLPPAVPFTDQVTPAVELVTVAVNFVVCPEASVAVVGETVTLMAWVVVELPPPHPQTNSIEQSNETLAAKILCILRTGPNLDFFFQRDQTYFDLPWFQRFQ